MQTLFPSTGLLDIQRSYEQNSLERISEIIKHLPCLRMIVKRRLVSWVMRKAGGMSGICHTLEEYRNKGFSVLISDALFREEQHTVYGEAEISVDKDWKFNSTSVRSKALCNWNYPSLL